jgi:hypothetical protein
MDARYEEIQSLLGVNRLLVRFNAVPSSPILVARMKEALSSSETSVFQEQHGVISQKTLFFIVTAVRTSSLTRFSICPMVIYRIWLGNLEVTESPITFANSGSLP